MINRRSLLVASGAALLPLRPARAATRKTLALELAPASVDVGSGQPAVPAWRFVPGEAPSFAQGDEVDVTVANRLPMPVLIGWRGMDGAPGLEPLLARGAIPPGGSATFPLSLVHAGTLLCDARLGGGTGPESLPVLPLIVTERKPLEVDHDVTLVLEDWNVAPEASFTVNGQSGWSIKAAPRDRLRLRFINGSQGALLAAQLSSAEVRVVAIDGQPAEPFIAREGRLLLAPGTRIDAIVDASERGAHELTVSDGTNTSKLGEIAISGPAKRAQPLPAVTPLPTNGLPEKIPLEQALRAEVSLDLAAWSGPDTFKPTAAPVFKAKRGRTVVLALTNPAETTTIFHLHGHHMRLLDRLDDGWKPFWLDTMAVPPRQTVRMAFSTTHPGAYLMEALAAGSKLVRRVRSYLVEA